MSVGQPDEAPSLRRRRLGRIGAEVTTLSLGGAGLGGLYGPVSDEQATVAINRAIDLGINWIDVSPFYGEAERRLGMVLAAHGGLPAGLHVSTKTGTHPKRHGDFSAEATRWSVENSLEQLGVDSVDLLLVHALDSMEPVLAPDGALNELERLREEGRIGGIGLGVRDHDFHRRAIASGRFDAILSYSDYTLVRQTAASLISEAAAADVGVMLGRVLLVGLLSGDDPMADNELAKDPDAEAARGWWMWAREREVPLQALALQFAMRNTEVATVLVGAKTAEEVEQNVALATYPISDEIWMEVDERVARGDS